MPRGSYTHHVVVPAPARDVWARFQRADTWKGIGPIDEISEVRADGDRLDSFAWKTHVGPTRYRGSASMVENVPGRRLVMRLDSTEMAGSLAVDLAGKDETHTLVDVKLDVTTKGTMSSLFFPIISEAIANGLPTQVDAFAARWVDAD